MFLRSGARIRLRIFRHELRRNIRKSRETYSVSLGCVGYELFSRAVASQVSSPLQRLTSVFGMGTGGPTALKTLTHTVRPVTARLFKRISSASSSPYFPIGVYAIKSCFQNPIFESPLCGLVHLRGLEPRTH